jgi:hypothetical protein
MIVSGEMPTPEEARQRLQQRQQNQQGPNPDPRYLGEPMPILGRRQRQPEPSK